jgi:hypothetical protein
MIVWIYANFDLFVIEASPHLYPLTWKKCSKNNNNLLPIAWDGYVYCSTKKGSPLFKD